jgi:asparaginyl-tRNA synthetase
MVEPEMVFADLETITNLAEALIKYVINYVLDNNSTELKYLENYDKENKKEIINKLKKNSDRQFKKIDYSQAIEILKEKKEIFVFNDIK